MSKLCDSKFWLAFGMACWILVLGNTLVEAGGKPKPFRVVLQNDEAAPYEALTYLPTCGGAQSTSNKKYSVVFFPRHDPCATVTTSTGYQLTDDIGITVNTTKGWITSVQLHGQDLFGEEGIMHESEVFPIAPPVKPSASGFTLHVHADHLPIWKLSGHLRGERVDMVGTVSIADITYIAQ